MKSQLDLILENLRLSSLEKLLMEATTEEEVQSGIRMINESITQVGELFENTEDELRRLREKARGEDFNHKHINQEMAAKKALKKTQDRSSGSDFKFKNPHQVDYFKKIQHQYS